MNHLTDHWLEQIDKRLAGIGDILDVANETLPTLRDQFAMAALTALLAHLKTSVSYEEYAEMSYGVADEMMKARKNEP